MDNVTKPELVINTSQLLSLIKGLSSQTSVAVDTESNSLYAYREQVCLIQFSIPGTDYLVDPLALQDIQPLGKVFSDPAVEKVFHAAEYDLLTLKRDFGFTFKNIFDTMVAARILGRSKVGLGSILEEEFGVVLQKKYQRANWGRRPLPKDMLNYASKDTHYLLQLRQRLFDELQQRDLLPLAREDFNRLCTINGNGPEPSLPNIWRMRGVKDLTPEKATVLKYLVEYRQKRAEKTDLPLFKVFNDKTLVAIAAACPGAIVELKHIPGMTSKNINRHGKGLLSAVKRGLRDQPSYPPRRPRLDDAHAERLEALRQWRKERARKMGVESDVVLPRDVMEDLAYHNPSDLQQTSEIMHDLPWRMDKYGPEITKILTRQT